METTEGYWMHNFNEIIRNISQQGYENITFNFDKEHDLSAIIAIHSTRRGPAIGGTRFLTYTDATAALKDCLNLAKGMSYKSAIHNLPHGGAKAVIIKPKVIKNRNSFFKRYGQFVNELNGKYITAVDSGTSFADIMSIKEGTNYVLGRKVTSNSTATGVYYSMVAAADKILGKDISEATIAIKGVGSVGAELCRLLKLRGAKLIISDIDYSRACNIGKQYGAEVADNDTILTTKCDILSPCALGGDLTGSIVPEINSKIICGAANNPLTNIEVADHLFKRGIFYLPDYLVNGGGLVEVAYEYAKINLNVLESKLVEIGTKVSEIIDLSLQDNKSPLSICNLHAENMIHSETCGV